ncbi:structural maintenance of chromosomes protein 4-like [Schistocerca piceifrons]|uniref:structural maintenance of chromosomes protein 4-like n=1 Tax=Schistocerca piceifrons TaxID=274613 RepID=UPI001F5E8D6E|nr:structural maintenance of chromosomes protein 4-like [Schistocerca piceifrons]
MEIPLVNGDDELLPSEDESDCELDLAGVNCVGDLAAVSTAQDRGRLIIWYIVITNFKSFAGTRTLGPFHEKVNAVVGPNGSGKSNVIDAILFVFGLKGYKLRAKNAASVIHCSEKFPNLDSCTVELHFRQIIEQNEERFEVVPDSKVTISRTVNKDNVSFYKMNGSVAKFDTIKMFLKSHGVDVVSGRYLILQGEVEQISLMKPKAANEKEIGFLEYLEDIFGSLKYKYRCQIISEKLEKIKSIVEEKQNARNIAKDEMENLREERERTVLHLQAKNEIARLTHILHQKYEYLAKQQFENVQNEICQLQADLENHKKRHEELQNKKNEITNVVSDLQRNKDELLSKKETVKESLNAAAVQTEKVRQEIKSANKMRDRGEKRLANEERKLEQAALFPGQCEKEIENLMKLKEETRQEQQLKEEKFNDMVREQQPYITDLMERHKKLLSELIPLKDAVLEKKINMDTAQSNLDSYVKEIQQDNAKREQLEKEVKENESQLKNQRSVLEELNRQILSVETDLQQKHEEHRCLKQNHTAHQSEVQRIKKVLEETKSSFHAVESMRGPIAHLLKAKREGILPEGVYGRLGDLGGLDKKYHVAVSEACGRLDNIVVDTVYTAQLCMELMKRERIGRGTFIPLDKHQHLIYRFTQPFQTPEGVPRLFDLIRVEDERILPAFYFALGDTLVAHDLFQANRIAFYGGLRYRVVTLQGNLVEKSGTMTGGKRTNRPVGMGETATATTHAVTWNEISRIEEEYVHVGNQFSNICSSLEDLENTITSKERWLQSAKLDICKLNEDIQHKVEMQSVLLRQLETEQGRSQTLPDPQLQATLVLELENSRKEHETALKKFNDIDVHCKQVKRQLHEIKTVSYNRAQEEIREVKARYNDIDKKIRKLTFAIQSSGRKKEGVMREINELKSTINGIEVKVKGLHESKKNWKQLHSQFVNELEELELALQNIEKEDSVHSHNLKLLTDEEGDLNFKILDITSKLNEKKTTSEMHKNTINFLSKKLKSLKPQVIPGIEVKEEFSLLMSDELQYINQAKLENDIAVLKSRIGSELVNVAVIEEFIQKEKKFHQLDSEYKEIIAKRDELQQCFELRWKKRFVRFMNGFRFLCVKLKEIYQLISLGGEAEFELVDSRDPFTEGIGYSVRPPQKSWKNISTLSGGEKTVSSLALVFALHSYRPSPFYILDEVDAALDSRNTALVGLYIKTRVKNSQFIIISLRSGMFELAHRVVGVFKQHQVSNSITINPCVYVQNSEDSVDLN